MNERILVIDDDPDILDLLQDLLGEEGYSVSTSTSSTLMLEHVERDQPDLILLDVHLIVEDGRILCRRLKANALTRHIPVILISAFITWQVALGESCADDFLAKPFNRDEVLEVVRKRLRQEGMP